MRATFSAMLSGALLGLLLAGCGDDGALGADSGDGPVFGGADNGTPDAGADRGDTATPDAPGTDPVDEPTPDAVADLAPDGARDAMDEDSATDGAADGPADDGGSADLGGDAVADADADAGPDTPDQPPPPTCEAPVVDLMDAAHAHPSRADTRRLPAEPSSEASFPTLPGTAGTPGGCYAPPVQCADTGGLTGTEVLHRWVPPAPGTYYATTNVFYDTADPPEFFGGPGFVPDPVLYALDSASPFGAVLGCNDDVWPGDGGAAFTFEVLPPDDGAGLDPVFFVVDAADTAGNGGRYGLEVGPVAVATRPGLVCQYPTIATACGMAAEPLFCVPEGEAHVCRTAATSPPGPLLLSVAVTAVLFPPEPPAEPPCRGVARDSDGNEIPIVQLRFLLSGESSLGLERVTLAHALFGPEPLAIDFPEGPVAPTEAGTFEVELRLCLPLSLVPFAPDDGESPIAFTVVDDLGWRTDPPAPQLGRTSNAQSVTVYDPGTD